MHGTTITEEVIAAAANADGIILGPVSHAEYPPISEGGLNRLGCYARRYLYMRISDLPEPLTGWHITQGLHLIW